MSLNYQLTDPVELAIERALNRILDQDGEVRWRDIIREAAIEVRELAPHALGPKAPEPAARLPLKRRPARIDISIRDYVFSHGRPPRGRGSWAFFFDGATDAGAAFWTPGSTLYAEARKLAVAEARKRGASRIAVGS